MGYGIIDEYLGPDERQDRHHGLAVHKTQYAMYLKEYLYVVLFSLFRVISGLVSIPCRLREHWWNPVYTLCQAVAK